MCGKIFETHPERLTAVITAEGASTKYLFISPLFNKIGQMRTRSHLQLRPGQDKAKQFDTYNNTELHME